MRNFALFLIGGVTLAGCTPEQICPDGNAAVDNECQCDDGSYPADSDDGECPPTCDDGYTLDDASECKFTCENGDSVDGPDACATYFIPEAVGIELIAAFDEAGELVPFQYIGATEDTLPHVVLTFADADFFGISGSGQLEHSCKVRATFEGGKVDEIPTFDGVVPWLSHEGSMSVEAYFIDDNNKSCEDLIDPDTYDNEGITGLASLFQNVHIGFGMAPLTETGKGYLIESDVELYKTQVMTQYIAINDKDGVWKGDDWNLAFMYETEGDTNTISPGTDDEGVLLDFDDQAQMPVPAGFLQSSQAWYQDFPFMDLTNLNEPAPAE